MGAFRVTIYIITQGERLPTRVGYRQFFFVIIDDYFPDIFEASSKVLHDIIDVVWDGDLPGFVRELNWSDYFGDKAVGRNAIQKIIVAWQNEPERFTVDKKKNKLMYSFPENGRLYELRYIHDELPPELEAKLISTSIVMDLDKLIALKSLFDELEKGEESVRKGKTISLEESRKKRGIQ